MKEEKEVKTPRHESPECMEVLRIHFHIKGFFRHGLLGLKGELEAVRRAQLTACSHNTDTAE